MYDIILKNGQVIDGSGKPAFAADVAVRDGKIDRSNLIIAVENRKGIIFIKANFNVSISHRFTEDELHRSEADIPPVVYFD